MTLRSYLPSLRRERAIAICVDILGPQGDRVVYHLLFIVVLGLLGWLLLARMAAMGVAPDTGEDIALVFKGLIYTTLANLLAKPPLVHGLRRWRVGVGGS